MLKVINTAEGKYAFIKNETTGELRCDRYGIKWREFIGDNAVHSLFNLSVELHEESSKLKVDLAVAQEENRKLREALTFISNSICEYDYARCDGSLNLVAREALRKESPC